MEQGNMQKEAKMDIYVDDDTYDHGHVPKITFPDTIEVEVGGHKNGHGHLASGYGHEHPSDSHHAGFPFELISDLPDNADGISYSNSHLSAGVFVLFSLATLGFLILKLLLKFHKMKKKKRKRKHHGGGGHRGGHGGPHAHFHHQSHISATPVVHNYISFDPHQTNIGYTSSSSKVKPPRTRRKRRRKYKHPNHHHYGWDRNGWDQEQNKLSGHDIQKLVNYLREQQHAQEDEDSDYYY